MRGIENETTTWVCKFPFFSFTFLSPMVPEYDYCGLNLRIFLVWRREYSFCQFHFLSPSFPEDKVPRENHFLPKVNNVTKDLVRPYLLVYMQVSKSFNLSNVLFSSIVFLFPIKDWVMHMNDILFWFMTGVLFLYVMTVNEIRWLNYWSFLMIYWFISVQWIYALLPFRGAFKKIYDCAGCATDWCLLIWCERLI